MNSGLSEIRLALGELRRIRFRLRRRTTGAFLNVNMAEQVTLEANRKHEVPLTPLVADRDSGEDDWTAGLVTFLPGPHDVTARVGTYEYSVIVRGFEDIENPVFDGGIIEVDRRTSVLAFRTDTASWYASLVQEGVATSNLAPGMPVFVEKDNSNGNKGAMSPATTKFNGVALAAASAAYLGLYADRGWVEQQSWAAVTGTEMLLAGATYYLAPGGLLALTGSIRVGVAETPLRLSFTAPA